MAQHVQNLAPDDAHAVVTVSKSFGRSRPTIARLVAWCVDDVLGSAAAGVHAKVKRAGPSRSWGVEVGDEVIRFAGRAAAARHARARGIPEIVVFTGPPPDGVRAWAYDGVPYSAHPGCDYLITIRIGMPRPHYPHELRYRKTVPIEVHSHTEEVVFAAAHEAQHTHQYMHGLPRSEVECDRMALEVIGRYRRTFEQVA